MRVISILIILVITLSIMATGASFHPCGDPGTPSLNTLDVCHSSPVAANSDLPYLSACPCLPLPPQAASILKPFRMSVNPFLIALQDERPPKSPA
jgi:hypothetical protein